MTTTVSGWTPSWARTEAAGEGSEELATRYRNLVHGRDLAWSARHRKLKPLGRGGQGVVYLCRREGSDGFSLPVALKFFSPQPYRDAVSYHEDMGRVGQVAARVALIQHDNLLDIQNFVEQDGIRLMEMEWVDGLDLRQLLSQRTLERTRARVGPEHAEYIDRVIATPGPSQPRLKPGIAIQVLRECLAGLAALHREGLVHGDLKPSNIMLKRTGHGKVIDIGSAIDLKSPSARRFWSPAYAAPEVLRGGEHTPQSDLASVGYVLVEMLAGRDLFEGLTTVQELLDAKRGLEGRLPIMLPAEVSCNELLLSLCRRLVAADPSRRFPSASAADLGRKGAADFHRQLVKGDLASEYENDLRVWLESLDEGP